MDNKNFTSAFLFEQSPNDVFNAINNVREWWSDDFKGESYTLNDEFEVNFGDVHYSKQKLTEVIPGKKVVWLVTGSRLNFLTNKDEWNGTTIIFDIIEKDVNTRLHFTHLGLVPEMECFKDCSKGWNYYLQSLANFITTGKGHPNLVNN